MLMEQWECIIGRAEILSEYFLGDFQKIKLSNEEIKAIKYEVYNLGMFDANMVWCDPEPHENYRTAKNRMAEMDDELIILVNSLMSNMKPRQQFSTYSKKN